MILLEGNMNGLVEIIFMILLGPPIVLGLIGFIFSRNDKKQAAKVFYILSVAYLVIGLGICGSILG